MKYTINVTQNHISKGKADDCHRCPIALATKDLDSRIDRVFVGPDDILVVLSNGDLTEFDLPQEAIDFIEDFDLDLAVNPFSFQCEVKKGFLPIL